MGKVESIQRTPKADALDIAQTRRITVAAAISRMSIAYNQQMGAEHCAVWAEALDDLAPDVIEAAIKQAVKDCKWRPNPNEVREIAFAMTKAKWEREEEAARRKQQAEDSRRSWEEEQKHIERARIMQSWTTPTADQAEALHRWSIFATARPSIAYCVRLVADGGLRLVAGPPESEALRRTLWQEIQQGLARITSLPITGLEGA